MPLWKPFSSRRTIPGRMGPANPGLDSALAARQPNGRLGSREGGRPMAEVRCEHSPIPARVLRVVKGSIADEKVDAIVNAANERLKHGGGVAGAIVRAGGYSIQVESDRIGFCPTGGAVATGAGNLRCGHVIHAVGPVWRGGGQGEPEDLASAVRSVLERADELGIASISMPAVSSGIFGFPKKRCAAILVETVLTHWRAKPGSSVSEVRFCNIDEETVTVFEEEFRTRFLGEKA